MIDLKREVIISMKEKYNNNEETIMLQLEDGEVLHINKAWGKLMTSI